MRLRYHSKRHNLRGEIEVPIWKVALVVGVSIVGWLPILWWIFA